MMTDTTASRAATGWLTDRVRTRLVAALLVIGVIAAIVAAVRRDLVAIAAFAAPALAIGLVRARAREAGAAIAERDSRQEHLEQQAVELEEQAVELQQQVEALTEARATLDAALSTVPIAFAIIDPSLRYVRVNAACAVMTGKDVEAHPGRTLREINPLLSPELEAAMRRVLATGEPCLDYRLTRPTPHATGGAIEIVMHITPFRDAHGAIAGLCSTATDITAWKALQEQFFQAQKLEAVGQLAAGIAHDFNNLLTIVCSCCEMMLLEMPDGSPHRADVEEVRGAANRATALARRMLAMSHSRATVAKPVELRAVVLEARDLLERAMGTGVRLDVRCSDASGVVRVDPTQLEQVLLNLVINAVHAMPGGGVVTVATGNVTLDERFLMRSGEVPAGEYVALTVADTGTGMSEATLQRIFEPFFTTKSAGHGTGLGLATVFAIVRELGGGIEVQSVAGQGTTFRVLLPRIVAEEASGPRRARTDAATALPRGTETLLLVEDEDAVRASAARVFARQGYRVIEARHGGEALRVLAGDHDVALVVSDLHMPGVGGRELSERIRATGRPLPMLFLSGSSDAGGGDRAEEALPALLASGNRFISKPFEVDTLLFTVREMLDRG